jgi:hypothetical protein
MALLDYQFSGRWGCSLSRPQEWSLLKAIIRLIVTLILVATATSVTFLGYIYMTETEQPRWENGAEYLWTYLFPFTALFGLLLGMMLMLGAFLARLSLAAEARGFTGTSRIVRGAAYISPLILVVTSEWYAPLIAVLGLFWVIQVACVRAILATQPQTGRVTLFRPLTIPLQVIIFSTAQQQWRNVNQMVESRLRTLSPREKRRMEREIAKWASQNEPPTRH